MENPINNGYGPITEEMLKKASEAIGITFPAQFIKWIVGEITDMGQPKNCQFPVKKDHKLCYMSLIAALLSFNLEERFNIVEGFYSPPEFFTKGLVAFGDTGFGDYICFDYRSDPKTDDPPVVYWAHEFDVGEDVIPLAPNFEAFLGMLMSEEEAEAALEKLNKEG